MVTIHLFASLREAAGQRRLEMAHSRGMTVADVLGRLCETHPELGPMRDSIRGAVNQSYADWQEPVSDGDEVAFFPPVSGGRG